MSRRQHFDIVTTQGNDVWRSDFILRVLRAARRDETLVLDGYPDVVESIPEFFRFHVADVQPRQLRCVIEREGHVTVAFFLEQERGWRAAPFLFRSSDFDLAIGRMVVWVPLYDSFVEENVLSESHLVID